MENRNNIVRILAFVLLVAMLVSTVASCGFVVPTPTTTTQKNEEHVCVFQEWYILKPPTSIEEGIRERKCQECDKLEQEPIPVIPHTCTFGHWEVIKEATITEEGLRERKCDECGKIEQEIIASPDAEFMIDYRNLKSAAYPEKNGYNSADGMLNLPVPEAEGYKFIGWYTSSIGGELIDYIPKGSKKDYILFAHWELITYEITYKNVPDNTNVTTYNIEDKVKLENPKWSGLEFLYWSDENGNIYVPDQNITILPNYTYGDFVLTANWKVLRNIARPTSDNAHMYTLYEPEEGFIYFYYDLGTIEHVVLDGELNPNLYYKAEGMPLNLTLSKTVTISEERAESISNTISKSVSSTRGWESSTSWAENKTKTNNNKIAFELGGSIGGDSNESTDTQIFGKDFNIKNLVSKALGFSVKAGIEGDFNWSSEEIKTNSTVNSNYGKDETNEATSNTVLNSLAYQDVITSEIIENYAIGADLPGGYYAYVHAGNIRIIGVVGYEIATGGLFLNTYSRLDNMHAMMMYYPTVYELNNPSVEGLDFTIPEEEILNMIENSYYIEYDANGGEGNMPIAMHSVDGVEKLAYNQFKKPGHIFGGWELTTDDGVVILQDGQSVTNIGKPLQTVTLKAVWVSTEPIWIEKESGSFYFANFPSTFNTKHDIYKTMEKSAYTSYETDTSKRVVNVEKVGYIYWHWMYDTVYNPKDGGCEQRTISDKYKEHGTSNYNYYFVEFFAFKSSMDCPAYGDRSYVDGYNPGKAPITYNTRSALLDLGIKTAQDGLGTPRMFRFEYYICTYTDYELAQ